MSKKLLNIPKVSTGDIEIYRILKYGKYGDGAYFSINIPAYYVARDRTNRIKTHWGIKAVKITINVIGERYIKVKTNKADRLMDEFVALVQPRSNRPRDIERSNKFFEAMHANFITID